MMNETATVLLIEHNAGSRNEGEPAEVRLFRTYDEAVRYVSRAVECTNDDELAYTGVYEDDVNCLTYRLVPVKFEA